MTDTYDHQTPSMNQKIFDLNLPVETISIYLLCCGFTDSGKAVSFKNLLEVWNSSREMLEEGLALLEEKNIVKPFLSDASENRFYQLVDSHCWRGS